MSPDDQLSRAIEMYKAAVETSVVTAEAYQKAKIALDIAYHQLVIVQESRKLKE